MAKERVKCKCGAMIVLRNLLHHQNSEACARRSRRKIDRVLRHNAHVARMRDRKAERKRQAAAA